MLRPIAQPPIDQYVHFFVGCGEGVCPKALQILPESDEVCEHSGQKTDILMEVWQLPHLISLPPLAQFSQLFFGMLGEVHV